MFGTFTRKTALITTGGALTALVLAGCGSSSSTTHGGGHGPAANTPSSTVAYGPAASGPHNDADVTFVTDMLPHHAQAVEMADMALSRDTNADVKALAAKIKGAQAPEISSMSGWLVGWGKPVPSTGGGHDMGGMGGGGEGMMSGSEMTSLDAASGTEFAKMWLTDMVTHHTGAVAMAKTELATGQNPDAKALATRIISSQSDEITTMTKLMSTLA
jgi:uncharacterized protein (DUF305 family)